MKKVSWMGIVTVMLMLLFAANVFAGRGWVKTVAADQSVAFRIINNSSSDSVSFVVTTNGAGNNMTVTIGSTVNTIDGSGTIDTIAELAAAIMACTNSSGEKVLSVDTAPSLAADSTDGELLDGTYTAAAGMPVDVLWDTSECKFWSVYLPSSSAAKTIGTLLQIKRISGMPGGTGNVTAAVYLDGTLALQRVYVSPIYILPGEINYTGTVTQTTNNDVFMDWEVNIRKGSSQSAIIRATRATTATTGILSVYSE